MWTSDRWPRNVVLLFLFATCLMSVRVIQAALSTPGAPGAGNGRDAPEPGDGPAPPDIARPVPEPQPPRDTVPPDPSLNRPVPFSEPDVPAAAPALRQRRRPGMGRTVRARLVLRDGIDLVHVAPNDVAKVTVLFDNLGTTPAYDVRQQSTVGESYVPPPDCAPITANAADPSQYVGREVRFNLQSAPPLGAAPRQVFVSGLVCYHDMFGTATHWTGFCVQVDVAANGKLNADRCAPGNDADL